MNLKDKKMTEWSTIMIHRFSLKKRKFLTLIQTIPEEDNEVITELLKEYDIDAFKKSLSVSKFRDKNGTELVGEVAIIEQLFKPGLSINGIESGYYGKGGMTIIPHEEC